MTPLQVALVLRIGDAREHRLWSGDADDDEEEALDKLVADGYVLWDGITDLLTLTSEGVEVWRVECDKRTVARSKTKFKFLKLRDADHTSQKAPGQEDTISVLRQRFVLNYETLGSREVEDQIDVLARMRATVDCIPDDFTDGSKNELERLCADVVARRLLNEG